jgi:hypothetical protein
LYLQYSHSINSSEISVNNKTKAMKTTRKIGLVTALLVSVAFTTKAQSPTPGTSTTTSGSSDNNEFRLSVGPEFGLPIGNLSSSYSWLFGGSIQADIPIVHNLHAVVNFAYDDAFVKTNPTENFPSRNLQLITPKGGLKYFFVDNLLYVQGTAGVTILGNHADAGADKTSGFVYSPQVGVLLKLAPRNYVDCGFYFQSAQSFWNNGGGTVSTLGLRLAYTLGL